MRYIDLPAFGAPEAMQLAQGAVPEPGPRDVLIEVAYAGVNRPDVAQRLGRYNPPPGASPVLGLEVSGIIVAAGGDVTGWKVGDAVCALTPGGGYAERVVTPAAHCLPVPRGLSMLEAAALPENFFTVWVNAFETCRLRAGETFLVHGGSSGIGLTAIQLAKAFGASVIVTAGSDEKCASCVALGADHAINYRSQDFVAEARRLTAGKGVNVVLDMVAGDYVGREIECLADDGRLAIIATQGGNKSAIDSGLVLRKRLAITGSTLRPRSVAYKTRLAQELREKVWPLIEAGSIKPVIHQVFPAEQARDAHALMESSTHVGKIVLSWK